MLFLNKKYYVFEELKKDYLYFCKILHPDNGGTKKEFQVLQNEYIELSKKLYNKHYDNKNNIYNSNEEYNENFKNIIDAIIIYNDLNIIIIGRWLWVNGNTQPKKELFKKLKFRWSANKKSWYYHDGKYHKGNGEIYTIDELKEKFKYTEIKKQYKIN